MAKVDFSNTAIAFERKSNKELKQTNWLFKMMSNNLLVNLGSNMTLLALQLKMPIKGIIKKTIFKQFCGGATLDECRKTVSELAAYQVGTVLDYGAEGKEDDAAFDLTVQETIKSIRFAAEHDTVPVVSCKVTGLTKNSLLDKITSQGQLDAKEESTYQKAVDRLDIICREAHQLKVALFIDAEESWLQGGIDQLTDVMMERYNKTCVTVYNTFQLYRHDRLEFIKKSFALAQEKGYILGAKLVRGAYMEKERERAKEMGYPSPIQPDKAACDADYNAAVKFCIENYEQIGSCVASHNEYSTQYQLQLMEEMNIPKEHPHFNFCQLYGMSDNLTFNLAKSGYNVAKYVPFGPVADVIPYLIRRAQENSAVDGEVSRELGLIRQEIIRRKKA
ncbi:proline dehydrogenase family protein [Aureispira anguillae]|uniref:Proline dehydrogenase family protein n=1 Tax=Aureispira anguillae TaxID=2864201 RepID=A0A915YJE6_9BACT|nr:proline dehydrogenase family protein [Aureispira anguillae]BDS14119.1 proline dehydrogenase family protein [Aureispira anguillae]